MDTWDQSAPIEITTDSSSTSFLRRRHKGLILLSIFTFISITGIFSSSNTNIFSNSINDEVGGSITALKKGFLDEDRKLTQLKGKGKIGKQRPRERPSTASSSDNMVQLLNYKGVQSKLSENNQRSPLVLYTIFAGRKETLQLQVPYIMELLEKGIVDEVHLWDLTCKQDVEQKGWYGKKSLDTGYLWEVMRKLDERIYIIKPSLGRCSWMSYYEYYSKQIQNDDVLMKVDDDIVFVDTSRVLGFARTIRSHPEVYLWSANVINNGISAGLHDLDGLIPSNLASLNTEISHPLMEGCLLFNQSAGMELHKDFVSDPQKYYIPPKGKELRLIKGRISINFVAFLGKHVRNGASNNNYALSDTAPSSSNDERQQNNVNNNNHHSVHQSMLMISLRFAGRSIDNSGGDEKALTETASINLRQKLIVYLPLVVAHASFGAQNLYDGVIPLYQNRTTTTVATTSDDNATTIDNTNASTVNYRYHYNEKLRNNVAWIPPENFVMPVTANI